MCVLAIEFINIVGISSHRINTYMWVWVLFLSVSFFFILFCFVFCFRDVKHILRPRNKHTDIQIMLLFDTRTYTHTHDDETIAFYDYCAYVCSRNVNVPTNDCVWGPTKWTDRKKKSLLFFRCRTNLKWFTSDAELKKQQQQNNTHKKNTLAIFISLFFNWLLTISYEFGIVLWPTRNGFQLRFHLWICARATCMRTPAYRFFSSHTFNKINWLDD